MKPTGYLKLVLTKLGDPKAWSMRSKTGRVMYPLAITAIIAFLVVFRGTAYDTFWRYFWGPILADATGSACAVKGGSTASGYGGKIVRDFEVVQYTNMCSGLEGIVAYPGYTYVSEIGYALILVLLLFAVAKVFSQMGIVLDKQLVFSLIPYMLFGGALRVVEDANDIVPMGVEATIGYPLNILLISPVVYGTMFLVTMVAILVSVKLERMELVDKYNQVLFAIGAGLAGGILCYLGWLVHSWPHVYLYLEIALVVLVMTTIITMFLWRVINREGGTMTEGVGEIGLVVLWSQILDGVANVVGIDWVYRLTGGMQQNLVPKHPINRGLVEIGSQFPDWITNIIGTAWPFLVIKVGAALLVIYIFDKEAMEENPGWTILLLIVIIAVGLGPGMRDLLRAVFGI